MRTSPVTGVVDRARADGCHRCTGPNSCRRTGVAIAETAHQGGLRGITGTAILESGKKNRRTPHFSSVSACTIHDRLPLPLPGRELRRRQQCRWMRWSVQLDCRGSEATASLGPWLGLCISDVGVPPMRRRYGYRCSIG